MLREDEIKAFIEEDMTSEKKRFAKIGQRYWDGEHDILQYRMFYYNADGVLVEDKSRSNSRICHPFFTELTEQVAPYILSGDENPIRAKTNTEGLQEHLDVYFDDEFWAEIQELISGTHAKGFEYLYGYKNADDRTAFECADCLGTVEIRAKDASDNQDHVLYHYIDWVEKDKKTIRRIQDHTKDGIVFYTQEDFGDVVHDADATINPRPHVVWMDPKSKALYGKGFGFIPFWRLDNNRKQFSALKPIKGLIDDYDMMQCGLSNNLQDFDTPIHLVKGFNGDDLNELQQNIKTKKIMGVDADGGLEILTVDVPYQARKTKADEDEKNIYRFGMGFNSSQVGDGNITNIVIRSRYTLLNLKANKLIKRLKRFLKDIVRVVIDEINEKNKTAYQYTDVEIVFDPVVPTNEQENVQNAKTEAETEQIRINTVMNAATVIGDEEALRGVCDILDLDFEELKKQIEKTPEEDLAGAVATLQGVVTDEPPAKDSTTTILEQ
jgi:SPP1 family phage portal protein